MIHGSVVGRWTIARNGAHWTHEPSQCAQAQGGSTNGAMGVIQHIQPGGTLVSWYILVYHGYIMGIHPFYRYSLWIPKNGSPRWDPTDLRWRWTQDINALQIFTDAVRYVARAGLAPCQILGLRMSTRWSSSWLHSLHDKPTICTKNLRKLKCRWDDSRFKTKIHSA